MSPRLHRQLTRGVSADARLDDLNRLIFVCLLPRVATQSATITILTYPVCFCHCLVTDTFSALSVFLLTYLLTYYDVATVKLVILVHRRHYRHCW